VLFTPAARFADAGFRFRPGFGFAARLLFGYCFVPIGSDPPQSMAGFIDK
jgi:hypothetical protein